MPDNFGLKKGVEGEKEFKKALSDIDQSFKVLGSEMKLAVSQFDKNVEGLSLSRQETKILGILRSSLFYGWEVEWPKPHIQILLVGLSKFLFLHC